MGYRVTDGTVHTKECSLFQIQKWNINVALPTTVFIPTSKKSVMFTATAVTFTHSIAHLFNTLSESKRPIRLLKDQLRDSVFAPTNHVAVARRQHSVHCPKWPPVVHTKHCVKVAVVSGSCKSYSILGGSLGLDLPMQLIRSGINQTCSVCDNSGR